MEVCDNTCYVDESTTCTAYCGTGKLCCMDDENFSCQEGGNGGNGGGSSSATCDAFDCGTATCSQDGSTCADVCKQQYNANYALCYIKSASDTQYSVMCLDRAQSSDSSCETGKQAYTDGTNVGCLAIGSDAACLTGGNGGGGSSSSQTCGEYCASQNSSYKAWCDSEGYVTCAVSTPGAGYEDCGTYSCESSGGGDSDAIYVGNQECYADETKTTKIPCKQLCEQLYGAGYDAISDGQDLFCGPTCSNAGDKITACMTDNGESWEQHYQCADVQGHLIGVPNGYDDCDSTCASATACK
jgi:hypothetical protein